MRQGSSCLPWESARCSTFSRNTSELNSDTVKYNTVGSLTSSKSQCPLRTGIRHWSTWSGNDNKTISSPDSIVTDNSSEVDFNSNVSPSVSALSSASESLCSTYRVSDSSSSVVETTDATKEAPRVLPSRPKAASNSQRDGQWHYTVEENRPAHANRLQHTAFSQQTTAIEVDAVRSRCRPRRRPCSGAAPVAPPKLRRDTECTDSLVRLIVFFSTKLVHAIWSHAAATPKTSKDFNGTGVLPLQVFIQETLRRSKTSYSTLQVALFYLILLRPHVKPCQATQQQYNSGCRALQCGRRMFLTALILASKYLQDRNYSARAWSKISGLPVSEINENERQYLELIKYNLHVTKDTFENWSKVVLTICRASGQGPSSGNKFDSPPSSPDGMYRADFERPGSPSWWSHHLLRLTPDVVKDTKLTEEYLTALASYTPFVDSNISLDTPPSSPENLEDALTDHSSPFVLPSGAGAMLTFSQASEFGQSPAFVGNMPSRPLPPNLPTPQTTPRYDSVSMFSQRPSHFDLRHRASTQALCGLEKPSLTAANLETCPPPKPRECVNVSNTTADVLRVPSDSSSALWMSSPESLVSDISSYTTRSRSSSMSSTTSVWSLPTACPKLNENQQVTFPRANLPNPCQSKQTRGPAKTGSYSFYHPVRPTASSQDELKASRTSSDDKASMLPQSNTTITPAALSADGDTLNETQVAQLLASLGSRGENRTEQWTGPAVAKKFTEFAPNQTSIGPSKAHKRNRSSKGDTNLQNEIRHLIWSQQFPVCVEDDKKPTTHVEASDKQAQYPSQHWARPRKPVPNALHNKRIALHHSSSPEEQTATQLAADFLRRDVTVM